MDVAISQYLAVSAITTGTTKQPFLLVYQKVTDAEGEYWLLRATDGALEYFAGDLQKNEHLR